MANQTHISPIKVVLKKLSTDSLKTITEDWELICMIPKEEFEEEFKVRLREEKYPGCKSEYDDIMGESNIP